MVPIPLRAIYPRLLRKLPEITTGARQCTSNDLDVFVDTLGEYIQPPYELVCAHVANNIFLNAHTFVYLVVISV